jgi:FkbM family methyltransferase
MNVLGSVKSLALRTLPPGVIMQLQKRYYPALIRRFSEAEEPDVAIVKHLISPGDVVVDLGAHVGRYSKVLSECVGPKGKVFSIEPIPTTFAILSHCMNQLGLTNVQPLNYGASDHDGRAEMFVPRQQGRLNFYMSRIADTKPVDAALQFSVELRAVDSLFGRRDDRIAFVKCDVEGHDLEALGGARIVLQRWKPALFVELSGDPDASGSRAHTLCAMLAELGYSQWWYDGRRLQQRRRNDRAINYFFLTSEHLARLQQRAVELDAAHGGSPKKSAIRC